ncbi:GNAT family N-acetyltransferase [Legionella sp. CNM-1927-20]|uniref:GNAT family N-acetyltransferase n=1 Tax=Legionella sp. CNM-1927-20 TaxID=3422221 RepID=UPI00403AAF52
MQDQKNYYNDDNLFITVNKMLKITICPINVSDIDKVSDLIGQLGYPILPNEMLTRIKLYLAHPLYIAFVAKHDSQIVGVIAATITDYFHRFGRFARIIAIIIDKNHRRRGIGKLLIQHVEKEVINYQCDFIEVTSGIHREPMGSHDFYKNLGYIDAKDKKKYFMKVLV